MIFYYVICISCYATHLIMVADLSTTHYFLYYFLYIRSVNAFRGDNCGQYLIFYITINKLMCFINF